METPRPCRSRGDRSGREDMSRDSATEPLATIESARSYGRAKDSRVRTRARLRPGVATRRLSRSPLRPQLVFKGGTALKRSVKVDITIRVQFVRPLVDKQSCAATTNTTTCLRTTRFGSTPSTKLPSRRRFAGVRGTALVATSSKRQPSSSDSGRYDSAQLAILPEFDTVLRSVRRARRAESPRSWQVPQLDRAARTPTNLTDSGLTLPPEPQKPDNPRLRIPTPMAPRLQPIGGQPAPEGRAAHLGREAPRDDLPTRFRNGEAGEWEVAVADARRPSV
jgi:hypothetical protein